MLDTRDNQDTSTQVQASDDCVNNKKSLTNEVSPDEVVRQTEELLNAAQEALRYAEDDLNSKPCLSKEFLNTCKLMDPDDGHYEVCVFCGLGGDVLCCESCPIVSHAKCVGLETIPKGDWYCEKCVKKSQSPTNDDNSVEGHESKQPDMFKLEQLLEEFRSKRQKEKTGSKKDHKNGQDEKKHSQEHGDNSDGKEESIEANIDSIKSHGNRNIDDASVTSINQEATKIEIGMKIVKRSLFDQIGEVISLPTENESFYEVQYKDGEVEKMELDDLKRGANIYSNMEGYESNDYILISPNNTKYKHEQLNEESNFQSTLFPRQKMPRKRGRPQISSPLTYPFGGIDNSKNAVHTKKKRRVLKDNKNTSPTKRKRGRPRKTAQNNFKENQETKTKRKRGRPRKSVQDCEQNQDNQVEMETKERSITIESLQWSPKAGCVDPSNTYYCTVENDTSVTIARKIGVEWTDVAFDSENRQRFPSLQNKKVRFRKGTLVRIPME